jgi:two-component sensor histidine kinase
MELTIPAAPAQLAGLRQAARHALREVPPQIADELVLALDEAATNAILYGSRGGDPVQVAVWVRATGSRPPWWTTAQPSHPTPHRPPTGSAAAAGGCGCLTVWSTRSGWSAPRSARG